VIGSATARGLAVELAEEVGGRIADAGAALVCGGLGGVMEAVSRGAQRRGGWTVGILPGDRASDANAYVQLPIPTGLGEARNVIVVRASQAVIAIAGGWGTLSEAAFCLKLNVPLILLQSDLPDLPVPRARSAEEAVAWALEEARRRGE
jgi:hypothetical protein